MGMKKIYPNLIGIALIVAFILSACNAAPTAIVPVSGQNSTASPFPLVPSAIPTSTPLATDTPIPTITPTPTAFTTATPTIQPVAQLIPSVNAFCRTGPGSGYDQLTILTSGTAYNVIGRNSLNTWWLVQFDSQVNCWTGAPGANLLGPVADAPIVTVPVTYMKLSGFTGFYTCNTMENFMQVTLYWAKPDGVSGYRLSRNGVLLSKLGAGTTTFQDNAPMSVELTYELEAFDDVGSTAYASVYLPACGTP